MTAPSSKPEFLFEQNGHILPRKSFGQNFLIDPRVTDRIISACQLTQEDVVLEIGPGKGALTSEISKKVKRVIAIEKDTRFCNTLTEQFDGSNVEIIHADFLRHNIHKLPDNLKVIGNLPYYITSPIIQNILLNRKKFNALYITIQLEMGRRLCAKPHCKEYGAFTCFTQYFGIPKLLFKIKNTAFKPIPKVTSCFMEIKTKNELPLDLKKEKILFQIIRSAFQQRRKTILNALATLKGKDEVLQILNRLNINSSLRAENLSLKDYINLAKIF